MSTIDPDDPQAVGYFLPEGSQLRLKKLRGHVAFLAALARPHTPDEGREGGADIRAGELATCLEWLEDQLATVLDELAWPARRGHRSAGRTDDARAVVAEVDATQPGAEGAGARYAFGVTLDQIDRINRLTDMILAHGDVVTASAGAGLADHTRAILGHAILDDVVTLREIIVDVNAQSLAPAHRARTGVREERAAYRALPACRHVGDVVSRITRQPTTCPSRVTTATRGVGVLPALRRRSAKSIPVIPVTVSALAIVKLEE